MTPEFQKAAENVVQLPKRPNQDQLLELYALYKQATEGDVSGSRPGMLDIKGRKKFDAWTAKKGLSKAIAEKAYVSLVEELQKLR